MERKEWQKTQTNSNNTKKGNEKKRKTTWRLGEWKVQGEGEVERISYREKAEEEK